MNIPPPPAGKRTKRLPEIAKTLKPNESILCPDLATAKCVRAYGVSKKWVIVQRLGKLGSVRVWRIS